MTADRDPASAEAPDFPVCRERGAAPHPLRIPWSVAEKAYSVYSAQYGTSQSLDRMAERGGFYPGELDEFFPGWREEASEITALRAQLAAVTQERDERQNLLDAIDAALDAAQVRLVALERKHAEAQAWSDLVTRGKSPCGHWAAYAVTTDGGKHITCLQCSADADQAQIAKLKRAVDGHPSAQTITRALAMIESHYEVSEVGADNGGFRSKLENYLHQIYKREPKVEALEAQLTQARGALQEHGKHPASCPKGVGVGYYTPPADAVCNCGIDAALAPRGLGAQ